MTKLSYYTVYCPVSLNILVLQTYRLLSLMYDTPFNTGTYIHVDLTKMLNVYVSSLSASCVMNDF